MCVCVRAGGGWGNTWEMWRRPVMPPMSTKAPYGLMDRTTPGAGAAVVNDNHRSSSERARCSRLEVLGHHTGSARLRDPHTIATSILFISLLLILLLVLPTIPAAPRIASTATATRLSLTVDAPPWPGLRWPPFL